MKKWFFSIFTLGLGGLYLWSNTNIVKDNEVALRRNGRGEYILLPPGRHSNFPWEEYHEPKNTTISNMVHHLGPYKIFTVTNGQTAKTHKNGELIIFNEGQYLIKDPSHTVSDNKNELFVSTQIEIMSIPQITATTLNNLSVTLNIDVQYQISDPSKAISIAHDVKKTIQDLATASVSEVMRHHSSQEFSMGNLGTKSTASNPQKISGLDAIITEMNTKLFEQYEEYGVELKRIFITRWNYTDPDHAHHLGDGVVQCSIIQAKIDTLDKQLELQKREAEGNKSAILIETEAQVARTNALAQAEADKVTAVGKAIDAVAEQWMGESESEGEGSQKRDKSELCKAILATLTMGNMAKDNKNTVLLFSNGNANNQINSPVIVPIQTSY